MARWALSRPRGIRTRVARGAPFRAEHAGGGARAALSRLARRRRALPRAHDRGLSDACGISLRSGVGERSRAADSRASGLAGMAARDAGDRLFTHAWPRGAHRQTMPAVRRRDVARIRHSPAVRHPRAGRRAVLGLGSPAARHPTSPVSFHDPAQAAGTPLFKPDVVFVKFNSFWTIELEPGYSLFATHPVNRRSTGPTCRLAFP